MARIMRAHDDGHCLLSQHFATLQMMKNTPKSAFTVRATVSDTPVGFIVIPRDNEYTECMVEFSTYCKAPTVIRKKGESWEVCATGEIVLKPADLKRLGLAIERYAKEGYSDFPKLK